MSSYTKIIRSAGGHKQFLNIIRNDLSASQLLDQAGIDEFNDAITKNRGQVDFVDIKDDISTDQKTISGLPNPQLIEEPDNNLLTLWLKFDGPFMMKSEFAGLAHKIDASLKTNTINAACSPSALDYYYNSAFTVADVCKFPGKWGNVFNWPGTAAFGLNTPSTSVVSSDPTYVAVTHSASTTALDMTTGFSYSCWIYPTDISALAESRTILAKYDDANNWARLAFGSNGIIEWHVSEAGAVVKRKTNSAISVNNWYHVTAVYNASANTSEVYLNAVAGVASTSTSLAFAAGSTVLAIGTASGLITTAFFAGYIDDFRYYKGKVCSAAEVSDLYDYGTISDNVTYPAIIGTSRIQS